MLDAEVAQAPCSAQEYKDKQIQCNTFVIYTRKALELWRNFMRILEKDVIARLCMQIIFLTITPS